MSELPPAPISRQYEIPTEPGLAFGQFWSQWGEVSGLSQEQLRLTWSNAENQYTDELPGHNFQHVLEVLWAAMDLTDICEEHGIAVNRKAVVGATLFHDAGLHEDFIKERYGSKEQYSAAIFESLAPRYGYLPEDIVVAKQAMLSTQLDVVPVSIEDKIMVRADLMNVGGDYESAFAPTTSRLMEEDKYLNGKAFDRLQFLRGSIRTLSGYLVNDLSLGPFEGQTWLKRPVDNLVRLVYEVADEQHIPATDFLRSLGGVAVKLLGKHFSDIDIDPEDKA